MTTSIGARGAQMQLLQFNSAVLWLFEMLKSVFYLERGNNNQLWHERVQQL